MAQPEPEPEPAPATARRGGVRGRSGALEHTGPMDTASTPPGADARAAYAAVSELFAALASPVRAAIVHRLTQAPCSVGELAQDLAISQPLTSQHLRTLRLAGLVVTEREGRSVRYHLSDEHVAHVFLDALAHSAETAS